MFTKSVVWVVVMIALLGCSSVSHQTARDMEADQVAIAGESCTQAVETASTHDELKWGRIVATPVLTVASAGLIPALLGANAALDLGDPRKHPRCVSLADIGLKLRTNLRRGSD